MKVIVFENTKIYVNKLIPFPGYNSMLFFTMIFCRTNYEKYFKTHPKKIRKMINHENIHKEQIKDFGLLFKWFPFLQILVGGIIFYLIYFFEWVIRLLINGPKNAYRNISFEKEAYNNELDYEYIKRKRKLFNQWRKK